jgi:dihydroorotase
MSSDRSDFILRRCRIFGGDQRVVDIAVWNGKVDAIGPALQEGLREYDCDEAFVSPAWIDSHVHVASAATPRGIDPLAHGPAQGVGALIDAGTAAPDSLQDLLSGRPWLFALANIDSHGIRRGEGVVPELSGAAADEALARDPVRVRGIKVQASASVLGESALEAIENAIGVAEKHGVPLMVHVGNPPPHLSAVCEMLRSGDVITHYAHGKPDGATMLDGAPLTSLQDAYDRGVLLDVGHGRSSFSYARCRALMDYGIFPSIISTDLHQSSVSSPVVSLARTMSKLLALGMDLESVVAAVTTVPARAFGLQGYGGPMEAGALARVTMFRVEERPTECLDSLDNPLLCERWLRPVACFLDDTLYGVETTL